MFELHPQLAQDSYTLGNYPLCRLLLINDRQYPWFVLVPRREDIREIYQLSTTDQLQYLRESSELGAELMRVFDGDKLNIGALGNMVPQLHIHHIVRFEADPAWPGPVWGARPMQAYDESALAALKSRFADCRLSDFSSAE